MKYEMFSGTNSNDVKKSVQDFLKDNPKIKPIKMLQSECACQYADSNYRSDNEFFNITISIFYEEIKGTKAISNIIINAD